MFPVPERDARPAANAASFAAAFATPGRTPQSRTLIAPAGGSQTSETVLESVSSAFQRCGWSAVAVYVGNPAIETREVATT